jgi:hypothetical protein
MHSEVKPQSGAQCDYQQLLALLTNFFEKVEEVDSKLAQKPDEPQSTP